MNANRDEIVFTVIVVLGAICFALEYFDVFVQ